MLDTSTHPLDRPEEEMFRRYSHIQRAPLAWGLMAFGAALALGSVFVPGPAVPGLLLGGLTTAGISLCFVWLRVRDAGDRLEIQFGPLPFFGRSLAYDDIVDVQPARSSWIDGWGVHLTRRGWIWNLWGFDCVAIQLRSGRTLRIGTDDQDALVGFLRRRMAMPF